MGQIPSGLRGRFLHNGPAKFTRSHETVRHHWDGDGAALAIDLDTDRAQAIYRFIRTPWFEDEDRTQQLLFSGLKTSPSAASGRGPFGASLLNMKNPVNTNLVALGDRLLALNEAGLPWALDPVTLSTTGETTFGLPARTSFSAHMRRHPMLKRWYSVGFTPMDSLQHSFRIFELDDMGRLLRQGRFAANGTPLIHDFVIAGDLLITVHSPVKMRLFDALTGRRTLLDSIRFDNKRSSILSVVNLSDLKEIARIEMPANYVFHLSSGRRDSATSCSFVATQYPDFLGSEMTPFLDLMEGRVNTFSGTGVPSLRLFHIDLEKRRLIRSEPLTDLICEFPTIPADREGSADDNLYVCYQEPDSTSGGTQGAPPSQEIPLEGGYARINRATGATSRFVDARYFTHELLPVRDQFDAKKIWLLTLLHDRQNHRTLFAIFTDDVSQGPVYLAPLPGIIPSSLHGSWVPKA